MHWPCKVAGKCISAVNSEAFRSYRKHSGGLYILEDKKKMHTFILSICQFWLLKAITSSSGAPDKVVRSNSAHRTSTAQRSPSLFTLTHKRFEIKRHLTCTISKQVSFFSKVYESKYIKEIQRSWRGNAACHSLIPREPKVQHLSLEVFKQRAWKNTTRLPPCVFNIHHETYGCTSDRLK